MDAADRQRFLQMAEAYDHMAPLLVPMYDFLQQEMIRQAEIATLARPRIVDLGAGSGRFLEKVLAANPQASCYSIDSSEAFLAVAHRRLARFGERVAYVRATMEDDWERQISRPVDAIFSMSAIHHLEHNEKQAIYAKCFDLLSDGGWFMNADEMRTVDEQAYLASLKLWARHVDQQRPAVPVELAEHAETWCRHFDNWKRRNIDGFAAPKSKGDDLHESFVDQVHWLRNIGFVEADVFVKYHLWCIVGGRKPDSPAKD